MYGDESQVAAAAAAVTDTEAAAAVAEAEVVTGTAALPEVLPAPRNVAPGGGGITGDVVKAEEECGCQGSGGDDCG